MLKNTEAASMICSKSACFSPAGTEPLAGTQKTSASLTSIPRNCNLPLKPARTNKTQLFLSASSLGPEEHQKADFWWPFTIAMFSITSKYLVEYLMKNFGFYRTVLLTSSHKTLNCTVTMLMKIIWKQLENLPSPSTIGFVLFWRFFCVFPPTSDKRHVTMQ